MSLQPRPTVHVPFLVALPFWVIQLGIGYTVLFLRVVIWLVQCIARVAQARKAR